MFGSSSSVKMYLTRLSRQIRSNVKQNVKSVCVATKNPAILYFSSTNSKSFTQVFQTWQQEVMNNIVFFLKHPPAASELRVIPVMRLLKILEAHLPQPWKR
jgi:hypothetical protein